MTFPVPHADNGYCVDHVNCLRHSFRRWLGKDLVDPSLDPVNAAQVIYRAPYVVVSHGIGPDPMFNYGNQTALDLFEMSWWEFTGLPSGQSAEPPNQSERAEVLARVTRQGYIQHYSGVRIAKTGRRFRIKDVTIWTLVDEQGADYGQAAVYTSWEYLLENGVS
ncbi:MAG: MEKHLA domain-containing protein [Cyanobacteriota bacterium]|nr:MEKHLA domain-containing protein [Cyanobacteriota bacterium]